MGLNDDLDRLMNMRPAPKRRRSAQDDAEHKPSDDIEEVRRALDNSQSLFMALSLIGPDPDAWKAEGFRRLIEEQAAENRRVLGPPT